MPRHSLHILLALFIFCITTAMESKEPFVRYQNPEYGFSVSIPSLLSIEKHVAPAPAHGVKVHLPSGGTIWIDGTYDAAFLGSATKAAEQTISDQNLSPMPKLRSIRAVGLTGTNFFVRKNNLILKQYFIYRPRVPAVSIIYTFGLETLEQNAETDIAIFDKIFKTFEINRLKN